MDNLLIKIRESYCELGERDKYVADFILANESEIPRMTISQIARGSDVSQAAVVRFCKLFGSDGFKDFRHRLTTDILEQAMTPQPASSYTTADLKGGEALQDIAERITAHNMRSISETKNLLDYGELEKAIGMLTNATRILFVGSGASGIVAQDAYQKFVRIGKICNTSQDSHIQMTLASGLQSGDVAVVISYSGKTKEAIDNAIAAKERGAYVIALTKYGSDNPLAKLGDIVLYTTSSETAYRSSATSSRITQLTLVDILLYGTLSYSVDSYQKNLETSYKYAVKKRLP